MSAITCRPFINVYTFKCTLFSSEKDHFNALYLSFDVHIQYTVISLIFIKKFYCENIPIITLKLQIVNILKYKSTFIDKRWFRYNREANQQSKI